MSIDLDIGALDAAARACSDAAAELDEHASSALSCAQSLAFGWEGASYVSFLSSVSGSAVPGARLAAGACRSLSRAMDDARRKAASLRARSEGFQNVLAGGGASSYGDGAASGRLYSDDGFFDAIDADLANVDAAMESVRSAFWSAEEVLWGMRTRSLRIDGEGFAAALSELSSRLYLFRD